MKDKGYKIERHFESRNGFRSIKVRGMKAVLEGAYGEADRIEFSIEPYLQIVYDNLQDRIQK